MPNRLNYGAGSYFQYFDNARDAGDSWLIFDLESPELVNTIGLYQNTLAGRKFLRELKLDFSDDPTFSDLDSVTTFILTLDEIDQVMYQQLTFDDVMAQYMRLTPTAYNTPTNYWGLGEVQLYYAPAMNGSSATPEPATWAMMLLAGVWLAIYTRKRSLRK